MSSDEVYTLRQATLSDASAIQAVAVAAKMFSEEEAGFLGEQLQSANQGDPQEASWLVLEGESGLVAAAFYAPEPFADRMWNLYFIAVHPDHQGMGLGKRIMRHVEDSLISQGPSAARTLVVETSSTAQYDGTRIFYQKIGYAEEARIRQFYGPEDDKVVFWKSLAETEDA